MKLYSQTQEMCFFTSFKRSIFHLKFQEGCEYTEYSPIDSNAINEGPFEINENAEALNNRRNFEIDQLVGERKSTTESSETVMEVENLKRFGLVAEQPKKNALNIDSKHLYNVCKTLHI